MSYVIWSEEHGAWWRAGGAGYTRSLLGAGRYSETEARRIVKRANRYVAAPKFHEMAIVDPLTEMEVVE
jgi:hypothetical protein